MFFSVLLMNYLEKRNQRIREKRIISPEEITYLNEIRDKGLTSFCESRVSVTVKEEKSSEKIVELFNLWKDDKEWAKEAT